MKFIVSIFLMSILFACSGDINEGKGQPPTTLEKKLAALNCDISSPTSFKNILSVNIQSDIDCAYSQVQTLITYIIQERLDLDIKYIDQSMLKEFAVTNFSSFDNEQRQNLIGYIDLFFFLHDFVSGSERSLLFENDLLFVKEFALLLNRDFFKITRFFTSQTTFGHKDHLSRRKEVRKAAENIFLKYQGSKWVSNEDISLLGLISRRDNKRSLDLEKLFNFFDLDPELKKFLFLKRVLTGGSKNLLWNYELKSFIKKQFLPLLDVVYDMSRYTQGYIDFGEDILDEYSIYEDNIKKFKKIIYSDQGKENTEKVFDLSEVINLFEGEQSLFSQFTDFLGLNLKDYKWEILRIKEGLLGNSNEEFTILDLKKIVKYIEKLIKKGKTFAQIYYGNNKKVKGILKADHSDKKNRNHLRKIVKTYKYYNSKKPLPVLSYDVGFDLTKAILIGHIEEILDVLIKFYEEIYPCDSKKEFQLYNGLTKQFDKPLAFFSDYRCDISKRGDGKEDKAATLYVGQIYFFILEFRTLFYKTGIVSRGREDSSAENVALTPDLFIHSANGNGLVEKSEIIEFFLFLFDGNRVQKATYDSFYSECRLPQGGGLDVQCVRKAYFQKLYTPIVGANNEVFSFNKNKLVNVIDYFPELRRYYEFIRNDIDIKKEQQFIMYLEKYSRSCPYDNVPFNSTDLLAMHTGLMAIEATMLKYDSNKNNIIDGEELDVAYNDFFPSLKAAILEYFNIEAEDNGEDAGWRSRLKGSLLKKTVEGVFKYMIKFERLPGKLTDAGSVLKQVRGDFQPITREKIMSVIVILQSISDEKRNSRYEELNMEYVSSEEYCLKYAIGNTLKSDMWNCLMVEKRNDCFK